VKTYVMADIHGGYKAMLQCWERSGFNPNKDELIVLGDVCDGWPETKECVEELMKVKNLVFILGNHDHWAYRWGLEDEREPMWIVQGGWNTVLSYNFKMPEEHVRFFADANLWMEDEETNTLFVHGGINKACSMEKQKFHTLLWDRDLLAYAKKIHTKESLRAHDTGKEYIRPQITDYNEIFIGHTSSSFYGKTEPLHYCNVWLLDTGGGWEGKLTIMDLDTREYWQSDYVEDLYKGNDGRREVTRHTKEVEKWLDYDNNKSSSI
jgi:serine/threonine protein phosphatase 1